MEKNRKFFLYHSYSGSDFYADSEYYINFEFQLFVNRKNYKIKINQKLKGETQY